MLVPNNTKRIDLARRCSYAHAHSRCLMTKKNSFMWSITSRPNPLNVVRIPIPVDIPPWLFLNAKVSCIQESILRHIHIWVPGKKVKLIFVWSYSSGVIAGVLAGALRAFGEVITFSIFCQISKKNCYKSIRYLLINN